MEKVDTGAALFNVRTPVFITIFAPMDEDHVVDILKDGSNSWVDYEE